MGFFQEQARIQAKRLLQEEGIKREIESPFNLMA
jgi:hypothetical protein